MQRRITTILLGFTLTLSSCVVKQSEQSTKVEGEKITFSTHIQPLISTKCSSCHNEKGPAPFTLATYEHVAKRAKDIRYVTRNRIMPPWLADVEYSTFKNERHLTENEIDLIGQWVDGGMNEGTSDTLAALELREKSKRPDLVLSLSKPNLIPGNNEEVFLLTYVPFELPSDEYVAEIEFVGDNKKLIHHCTYYFYDVQDDISLEGNNGPFNVAVDVKHSKAEKERFQNLSRNLAFFAGWIPGAGSVAFPEDIGFRMPRRGMLMITMHYAATPIDATDNSYLNVYFHKRTPLRKASNISVGTGGLGTIKPALVLEPEQTSDHRVDLPVNADISVFSIWPHMHFLGKSIKAYALDPKKDTIRLIKIPEWDFAWQEIYYSQALIKIPTGSTLVIEATFDNTSANPNNPFQPPRRVVSAGNMSTTDEMLTMMVMYLLYQPGDENRKL